MSTETLESPVEATEAPPTFTLPDNSTVTGPWKPGRYYTYKSNDGSCEYLLRIDRMGQPSEVIQHKLKAVEATEQKPLSPAEQLLQELRSNAAPDVEEIEVVGRKFYIRRMAWEDITAVWLLMPRLKNGFLDWNNKPGIRAMTSAMLQVGVVSGFNDPTPYFDSETADAFVSDPVAAGLVEELFQNIDRVNPTLLPKAEAPEKGASNPNQSDLPNSTTAPNVMP